MDPTALWTMLCEALQELEQEGAFPPGAGLQHGWPVGTGVVGDRIDP